MKHPSNENPTVSLVLGSGGARGLTHIGVIQWLEEHDYEIKSIAGCSIGSLIGGVYAAGKLKELEQWMRSITTLDMASLLDISWSSGGIFKGDKIISTLVDLLEDVKIEDLPIPYTAVAADILTEKEVWMNTGSLFDAIRASISLPLFFTPVTRNDYLLIDGGVLNPVPIAPTFNDDTDLTIAVNLGGPLLQDTKETIQEMPQQMDGSKWEQRIKQFIQTFDKEEKKPNMKNWGMYDLADKAFDAMQGTISRLKIAAYPPDVDIEIARNACGTFEFDRAAEMIQLGYEKAEQAFVLEGRK